jgi:hypothetical protein
MPPSTLRLSGSGTRYGTRMRLLLLAIFGMPVVAYRHARQRTGRREQETRPA